MPSARFLRLFPRLVSFAGATGVVALPLCAAGPKAMEMVPFTVEAEFGVDGLRIQNSRAVLNQHLLNEHAAMQLQDVSGLAPNLFTSNSDSRGYGDVLSLRGVANSLFFSAPAVALYVDDVPSGSVASYPSALLAIESFAVKAGPQGTDYGRNAPAGVVEITTRGPGAQHQGTLLVERGSFPANTFQAAVDGPMGGGLGYSAAFGYSDREGYITNTFLNRPADDRRSLAARGALHWKPDDKTQLRFALLAEKVDDGANRLSSLFSPDRFQVGSDVAGATKMGRLHLSFQARHDFGWGTVTATTSRQEWDLDPASTDLDLSPLPLAFSEIVQNEEVWTQEIRFESLPAADRRQWRGGLFYFDSGTDGDALREFVVPPSQFVPPGFVQTERTRFELKEKSLAGYANLDQPVTDKLTLKLGARIERTESAIDRVKASSNNFRFPAPPDPRLQQSRERDYVSASGGAVHAVSESLNVSARTSLAHKPAGYSAFTADPQLARFAAEKSWANEIGLTFGPPNARFGGSLLGFWTTIDDFQFERTVPNSTDFVVVNANRVTSRGLEAKFMWQPMTRIWWDFQAGYTEATFDDHRDATGADVADKRVPFIPEFTLRTGLTVEFGRGVSANASYAAFGRTFFDERNAAMFSQPAYGIVNARIECRFDRWAATVHGLNLTDKQHYQFINPEIFAGSPGAPRRFGVQLSYSY